MIVAESQNQASETNEPCGQIYQTISPDDETHGSLSAPPPPPTRGARLGLLLHDVYLRPFPPGGF